jgi:hypothetical protein
MTERAQPLTILLEKLYDLHHQATVERSHYYVGSTLREVIAVPEDLRRGRTSKKEQP